MTEEENRFKNERDAFAEGHRILIPTANAGVLQMVGYARILDDIEKNLKDSLELIATKRRELYEAMDRAGDAIYAIRRLAPQVDMVLEEIEKAKPSVPEMSQEAYADAGLEES